MKQNRKTYEAPTLQIVEAKFTGMICNSGGDSGQGERRGLWEEDD